MTMAGAQARRFAVLIIAATEGAVALCRAERGRVPFGVVAGPLTGMVTAAS